MNIIKGDIHNIIKTLPSNTYDLLYSNPPFSMTGAKWDKTIRFEELWTDIWRILKPNGAVILHSTQYFTHKLVSTQLEHFKYNYVWLKNIATNFFLAKKQPLRITEDICVFYKKQPTYNPQMKGNTFHKKRVVKYGGKCEYYGNDKKHKTSWGYETENGGHKGRYPNTLLEYPIRKSKASENNASTRTDEMVDFFIKTYTNEEDHILDITCYDALTGKRAKKLNRNYTGIDLEPKILGTLPFL